jgi:phospholipid/cholesterol/gamma-HCH transport system ATP-binding protein
MIEVKDLKKGFSGKPVINRVNAVFEPGKCNLIIGSSGSGQRSFDDTRVSLFEPDSGDFPMVRTSRRWMKKKNNCVIR